MFLTMSNILGLYNSCEHNVLFNLRGWVLHGFYTAQRFVLFLVEQPAYTTATQSSCFFVQKTIIGCSAVYAPRKLPFATCIFYKKYNQGATPADKTECMFQYVYK
jgi:hypothetical protein